MSYNAIVCALENVRKHSNADRLLLADACNTQVIVDINSKEGDLGIFFPTDGQLSKKFAIKNKLLRSLGGYFDDNRRIRAQNIRGERSEGFWLPLSCLKYTKYDVSKLVVGTLFCELNKHKICNKYISHATLKEIEKAKIYAERRETERTKRIIKKNWLKRYDKTFKEHYETKYIEHCIFEIPKGATITITEKMHGTSQRTGYVLIPQKLSNFQKLINKIFKHDVYPNYKWGYIAGAKKRPLEDFKGGYYKDGSFRKLHHDRLCNKNLLKGETFYYEIVGWVNNDITIMPVVNTEKIKDEAFKEKYGKEMNFKYGNLHGFSSMYVYRITTTNEDGDTVEYSWERVKQRCCNIGLNHVEELVPPFIYDGDREKLLKLVKDLCVGESIFDKSHIREGVVVRIDYGMWSTAYKYKSYEFKVLEGLLKDDSNAVDIEEIESLMV